MTSVPTAQQRRQKRVFFIIALVFTLIMLGFSYDFMRRTTRPGAKKHLPTSIAPKTASNS